MTSSEKRHFIPFRITSSGDKDLKSFRINTSKKHPGVGGVRRPAMHQFFRSSPDGAKWARKAKSGRKKKWRRNTMHNVSPERAAQALSTHACLTGAAAPR
jgi:hypothetical protein